MAEITISVAGVQVAELQGEHFDGILDLMNKEGWYYYDPRELARYLDQGQACFVLLEGERVVGSLFTTRFGTQAWIGNIVVEEAFRGRGLAGDLLRGAIAHLHDEEGIKTFRLGSVPLAIGVYKKVGFRAEGFTSAQQVGLPLEVDDDIDLPAGVSVEAFEAQELDGVCELDALFFKSDRRQLITALYADSLEGSCCCLKDRGKVVGFIMLRRREASKQEGGFVEGPDHVYRLGPSCVLPRYGVTGFRALLQRAIGAVNEEVRRLGGSATLYVVFPKNARQETIYKETRALAEAMGMDASMNLDRVFDEHDHIFGAPASEKNEQQWRYMKRLGFHQEYFEQVMSYAVDEATDASQTRADAEGIFASATPGDKA